MIGLCTFQLPKVQGTYKHVYGESSESPFQLLQIHYVNPTNILFYLEEFRGAPDYNSGALYGRLTLNNKSGHYEYLPKDITDDCKLDFVIRGNKIIVKTVEGDCQFGYGVFADGTYTMTNRNNPAYFDSRKDRRVYFDKTSPDAVRDY